MAAYQPQTVSAAALDASSVGHGKWLQDRRNAVTSTLPKRLLVNSLL